MYKRRSLKSPVSIGTELAYQQALSEALETGSLFASLTDEASTEYKLAQAASESAWDALTATVDTYVSRRVLEALKL